MDPSRAPLSLLRLNTSGETPSIVELEAYAAHFAKGTLRKTGNALSVVRRDRARVAPLGSIGGRQTKDMRAVRREASTLLPSLSALCPPRVRRKTVPSPSLSSDSSDYDMGMLGGDFEGDSSEDEDQLEGFNSLDATSNAAGASNLDLPIQHPGSQDRSDISPWILILPPPDQNRIELGSDQFPTNYPGEGRFWVLTPDEYARSSKTTQAQYNHATCIMETTAGEQLAGDDRCKRCRTNGHECWVYNDVASDRISRAGTKCVRCRLATSKPKCIRPE